MYGWLAIHLRGSVAIERLTHSSHALAISLMLQHSEDCSVLHCASSSRNEFLQNAVEESIVLPRAVGRRGTVQQRLNNWHYGTTQESFNGAFSCTLRCHFMR